MASTAADAARRIGIRLAALAQDGLTFAPTDYDLDRYRQVGQLAADLLAVLGAVQPPAALETLDVGWFGLDSLPPLSLGRVNDRQLQRALAHHRDPALATEFD